MSGVYDIKRFMDDYYENDVYYNNPMDFVPNINKQSLLNDIRDVDFSKLRGGSPAMAGA